MKRHYTPSAPLADGTDQPVVGCEFFSIVKSGRGHRYPRCGKPSTWKWTTTMGNVAHYCQEHGDAMRDEGRCAESGKWERLTANRGAERTKED